MKPNAVVWFEIYVDDIARAKNFYEEVFKITLTEMPMPASSEDFQMLFFPTNGMNAIGATGALVKMKDFEVKAGGIIIYFACEDCAIEEARVREAGGEIFKSKMSIGEYGFISLVKDTEGNIIGLHSMN